jgi:hypothetical protein
VLQGLREQQDRKDRKDYRDQMVLPDRKDRLV